METVTMPYSRFKKSFADCKTVKNSYDCYRKQIDVILPKDRYYIDYLGWEKAEYERFLILLEEKKIS